MKIIKLPLVVALAAAGLASARADITIDDPAYSVSDYYNQTNQDGSPSSDNIVSYDWDASNDLFYMSSTPDFSFGGLYEVSGGTTSTIAAADSDFPGASVVSVGDFIYYNTSTDNAENIYVYNSVLGGTPTLTSTATNFGLYVQGGQLFITGSPNFGTNHIYLATVNANGTVNQVSDLGADSGSSGPLAFDAAGNLYYAPGFGDQSIYKWTAAQVAAAIADPTGHALSISTPWFSYANNPAYDGYAGGTALLVDGNQLLLSLTNFGDPSDLVALGIAADGDSDGTATTILSSTDTLGDLRDYNGTVYLSDANSIYQVNAAPEPSVTMLLLAGLGLLVAFRRRTAFSGWLRGAAVVAMLGAALAGSARATEGPFSPAGGQPGSTGVAADDPNIVGWATGVVSFNPGPVDITDPTGAVASYGTPSNALGPSDATASDPSPVVSLGDGGSITLSFASPITNGPGADFAVYENGFSDGGSTTAYFLELATVSVSSNGVNFFTFPSVSLTQTGTQVASFGTLDPTYLYNLAGSQPVGYGTPFNLDDLSGVDSSLLNLDDITEVRITDVIGNRDTSLGTGTYTMDDATNPIFNGQYGTSDHVINDPFKTNFSAGGFDLDAVGVINALPAPEPAEWSLLLFGIVALGIMGRFSLFPRPVA